MLVNKILGINTRRKPKLETIYSISAKKADNKANGLKKLIYHLFKNSITERAARRIKGADASLLA